MPHSNASFAPRLSLELLSEEALREDLSPQDDYGSDGFAPFEGDFDGLEGDFDPDTQCIQLDEVGFEQNPLQDQVFKARRLVRSRSHGDTELFATGLETFDELLQGGVARGEMIEVLGAPGARTSGRFSLVQATLALATQNGEQVALVDLGDHLDPQIAERTGVCLERLLWLRPQHVKQALGAAELLLVTGFPLVVLDLGAPPVPGGRGQEAAWLRLARAAQSHRGALLVSSPYRASGTAATAVVEVARGRAAWWRAPGSRQQRSPSLLAGVYGAARLEKARARLKPKDVAESLLSGSFGLSLPSEGLADLDVERVAARPRRKAQPASQKPRLVSRGGR
ncbi:MAG: hypothetical protein AAGK22_15320 [Acidobacteriota bacterium]